MGAERDHGPVPSDPAHLLERFQSLPAAQPLDARLRSGSAAVHLVGGAVRDLMLEREPRELDLVVESDLEPVVLALAGEQRQFERFGTATIRRDGFVYDLARARSETYARPGALPIVAPADLATDLRRRDFTVNAIALGLYGPARGRLVAAGRAFEDLGTGRLRVLHPTSFLDDPTRLLRLTRYASRLGFEVEPVTFGLAQAAVASSALQTVSGNRVGAELRLTVCEADPVAALAALAPLGIDAALAPGFGLSEPEPARRALELLPDDGDRGALVIAAAALRMESVELDRMLTRLAFGAAEREAIRAAALVAPGLVDALAAAATPSAVATAVGAAPVEAVALAGGLAAQRRGGGERAARRWLDEWRLIALEIDGADLLAAGLDPGPAVGAGLRAALEAKLDGRARGREAELAAALRAALA